MSDINEEDLSESSFLDTDKLEKVSIAKLIQLTSSTDAKISLAAATELRKIVDARKDREVNVMRVNRPQGNNFTPLPGNTFNILANPEAVQKMTEGLLQVTAASMKITGETDEIIER